MASKRDLKKDIRYLTDELLGECYLFSCFHDDEASEAKADEAMKAIALRHNELIERINRGPQENTRAAIKAFYNEIGDDMVSMIDILDKMA